MLDCHAVLKKIFGFSQFRGLQEQIITHLISGGDAIVLMPTGGGKSLCYQLPAIVRPGTGLVVSPLIALMQDQVMALQRMGVRAEFLNSSLESSEASRVCRDLRAGKLDLLYVSPERALMSGFLEMLSGCPLSVIAIDEAHCVSQWGHDFRPEYIRLGVLHELFADVPRIALTATADTPTRNDIALRLELQEAACFISSFDRPNIRYYVVPKSSRSTDTRIQVLNFIDSEHRGEAGILYCQTRAKVERTTEWLLKEGYEALPYHAGMSVEERQNNQRRFLLEEGVIMVATVAFGMGIDKPNVRFVVHLDMPRSLEAYYQETGRAGRDGLPASAWMAYGMSDIACHLKMMEGSNADEKHKTIERRKLTAMLGYCETTTCRRRVLLNYFGEEYPAKGDSQGSAEVNCGNCDCCLQHVASKDGTIEAQKALSAIYRTGERFGVAYLTALLRGVSTPRMVQLGHNRLPTFGVGSGVSEDAWSSIFRQLVAAGLVDVDVEGFGGLRLNPRCFDLLRGNASFSLRCESFAKQRRIRKAAATMRLATAKMPLLSDKGSIDSSKKNQLSLKGLRPTGRGRSLAANVTAENDRTYEPASADDWNELFEALRLKRRDVAREEHIAPYMVFNDTTLVAMAKQRPASLEDFASLVGVGEHKLNRYGEMFITFIRDFTDSKS